MKKLIKKLLSEALNFHDETRGASRGESKHRIILYDDDTKVAYADYTVLGEDEVYIDMIESLVKGKEYGQMVMKKLAEKYGYENLHRSSLTPSGANMRQKLDKHFNFNYDEYLKSKNKHLKPAVIDNIYNPVIKKFIQDIMERGYEYGWKENLHNPEFKDLKDNLLPEYDLDANDLADIAGWVIGSKSNDNHPSDDVPHGVMRDLSKVFKIK